MDRLPDVDEALLTGGQQQEQPQERTQVQIDEERQRQEVAREQEFLDECDALRDWGERCTLVMSKRRQIEKAFRQGLPPGLNYYQTPSPIDEPSPRALTPVSRAMRAIIEEFFEDSSQRMAPVKTESDPDVSPKTLGPPVEAASDSSSDESDVVWEDVPGFAAAAAARGQQQGPGEGEGKSGERAGSDASLGSVSEMVFPLEIDVEEDRPYAM